MRLWYSEFLAIVGGKQDFTYYAQCNSFTEMHTRLLIKTLSVQEGVEYTHGSMCFPKAERLNHKPQYRCTHTIDV